MKYLNNQICTKDNEVIVGNQYDYSEDRQYFRVLVSEDNTDADYIKLKLRILSEPRDEIFDVCAMRGRYAYNGMWRLWDAGTYISGNYSIDSEVIPPGNLIGYSLSKCVGSICRNNIDLDRIVKIVARTAARDEHDWDRLILDYNFNFWYPFKGKGAKVCRDLIKLNKIIQPRLTIEHELMRNDIIWEAAD